MVEVDGIPHPTGRSFDSGWHRVPNKDETQGRLIREPLSPKQHQAKAPRGPDKIALAPLRRQLIDDFTRSHSWPELQGRLMLKGYVLRISGAGLALHGHPGGGRLCKASDLGHSYGALMRQFGLPFPGHAHRWLANHFLGNPACRTP